MFFPSLSSLFFFSFGQSRAQYTVTKVYLVMIKKQVRNFGLVILAPDEARRMSIAQLREW